MQVTHLPCTASAEQINTALEQDACVVIDNVISHEQVDVINDELKPHINDTARGTADFAGAFTKRTGAIIARSPSSHALINHPLILDTVKLNLADASNYHLHLTQMISISPGERSQPIHRDQWAFDFFPFPKGYNVQCNTIWAMTDFTEENGATRVIPGSGDWDDKLRLTHEQTIAAEMTKGSVLLYTGNLYHGGGANQSDQVRMGLNITYARAFLTQEENQFLSVPAEIAKTLPIPMLRLMGYAPAAYALNYVANSEDPITTLLPDFEDTISSL